MKRNEKGEIIIMKLDDKDERLSSGYEDVILAAIEKLQNETSFYNYVEAVLEPLFAGNYEAPIQSTIVSLVRKVKYSILDTDVGVSEWTSDQSNVKRQLDVMIQRNIIYKDEDKRYKPYDVEYKRQQMLKHMRKEIRFNREKAFFVSSTTLLLEVNTDSFMTAKKLFKDYLGEHCYKILEHSGLMVILLEGSRDELKKIRKDIKSLVKDAYNN